MSEVKEKHSAGGLLFVNDSILLIHWDAPRDSYNYPKGSIDEGETAAEACIREVFEETGYRTKVVAPIGQNEFSLIDFDGLPAHKVVDYFLVESTGEAPTPPHREIHETFENVWVPIEKARSVLTNDIDIPILERALELKANRP